MPPPSPPRPPPPPSPPLNVPRPLKIWPEGEVYPLVGAKLAELNALHALSPRAEKRNREREREERVHYQFGERRARDAPARSVVHSLAIVDRTGKEKGCHMP